MDWPGLSCQQAFARAACMAGRRCPGRLCSQAFVPSGALHLAGLGACLGPGRHHAGGAVLAELVTYARLLRQLLWSKLQDVVAGHAVEGADQW